MLVVLAACVLPATGYSTRATVAAPAPDFALKTSHGQNLRLSEYRGEVVLINFWAAWCGKCRKQLPHIQALHDRHTTSGFTVLAVNIDDDRARADDVVADLNLQFPVLFDPDKTVAKLYDPGAMPLTVIIDHDGIVRYLHQGFENDDAAIYEGEVVGLLAN